MLSLALAALPLLSLISAAPLLPRAICPDDQVLYGTPSGPICGPPPPICISGWYWCASTAECIPYWTKCEAGGAAQIARAFTTDDDGRDANARTKPVKPADLSRPDGETGPQTEPEPRPQDADRKPKPKPSSHHDWPKSKPHKQPNAPKPYSTDTQPHEPRTDPDSDSSAHRTRDHNSPPLHKRATCANDEVFVWRDGAPACAPAPPVCQSGWYWCTNKCVPFWSKCAAPRNAAPEEV
ncbi:hypothetical protein CC85DRAFT_304837 [Cutaneotrichosporon oleaginosum]|uniref:CBM1 domain-containing protein n=1 Tax=Cutaneotrichosporon oleaginosum TaxID=879819 RepID=A0A0J0XF34_9TREE|nr:uncharacterized protein CC85DRAFT_304837 [Cutaneotrichosporon oleaginosum]KLT39663.1 hypothetical protein CC85DRAFT_304837 [Cutaneotrichosporon oleaginosum]TXT07030.1 hypothetical protein COLE_06361 [Cutaneotrichosporon oleaginosum]